jgi:hypothetical protein
LDPVLLERLKATNRDLDVIDEYLKAIEEKKKENMAELRQLEHRIVNMRLD